MLRIPGVRSDDVCSTAALRVVMLSWFDLLLLCTSHTHIHDDYWRKGESLRRGYRCTAAALSAAVLAYTPFVDARLSGCLQKINYASLLNRLV